MADDASPTRRADPTRRAVLTAAAWTAPVIASTFVPAIAQSAAAVPISKLRIGDDWKVLNGSRYDPATNSTRGPLAIYASAHYDQNVTWWPTRDPEPALVQYTLQVVPPTPAEPTTLSGSLSIALGGYAQQLNWYPGENVYPLATGTYTVTFTIYGSGGTASEVKSIVLT
ncbi:hypothetical protein [Microbacterium enclense]|uniref:hypothetical protein n=1 Tax=Microbacterium enclense TaxID=993073 RepID=UPI003D72B38F